MFFYARLAVVCFTFGLFAPLVVRQFFSMLSSVRMFRVFGCILRIVWSGDVSLGAGMLTSLLLSIVDAPLLGRMRRKGARSGEEMEKELRLNEVMALLTCLPGLGGSGESGGLQVR